jgi:uncharacterized membrane protein
MTQRSDPYFSSQASITGEPDRDVGRRLESVDLLRGAVMVLMVIDHVREFFMDARVDPTNLAATTPALFFTRWITHFCAPTFVFLAGVGAALSENRGKTRAELSLFLLTRGLWLILLEETVVSLCVFFAIPKMLIALIFWAIGWSMIALAGLIFLPRAVVGGLGLGMIALHNLLDGVQVPGGGALATLWGVLHQPGIQRLPGGLLMLVGYPLIPWIGVMASGDAFGPVLSWPPERRRPILLGLGFGLIAGFVILRASHAYGDPRPWSPQSSPLDTAMSFLNCQKYPPSLLFLMMTMGPAILALAALDRGLGRLGHPLLVFGRVPLFFYLLQWPVAHGLAVAVEALRGQPVGWLFGYPLSEPRPGYGHGLPMVYLMSAVTVLLLYYPCRWFAGVKSRRRDAWLSYF